MIFKKAQFTNVSNKRMGRSSQPDRVHKPVLVLVHLFCSGHEKPVLSFERI